MAGVPEEVSRLNVNVDDVSSVLFAHHHSTEPMVFYLPNKAVRNILKLHVNEGGGYLVGSLKCREAKYSLENGYPVYTIADDLTPLPPMPSDQPHPLKVDFLLDCLKTNVQQPLNRYWAGNHGNLEKEGAMVGDSAAHVRDPATAKRNLSADFARDYEREQSSSSMQQPLDSVDRELIDVLSVMRDSSDEEEEVGEEEEVHKTVGQAREGRKQEKRVHIVLPSPQHLTRVGQKARAPSQRSARKDQDDPMEETIYLSDTGQGSSGGPALHRRGQHPPDHTASVSASQNTSEKEADIGSLGEGAYNIVELQCALRERTARAIIECGTPVLPSEVKLAILTDVTGMGRSVCSRALCTMSQDMWEALKCLCKVSTVAPWTERENKILVNHLQDIHRQLGPHRSVDSVLKQLQYLASQPQ